jgi:(2Fe-2S) ferredoxin
MNTACEKKVLVCTNFRGNPNSPSCAARGSKNILAMLSKKGLEIDVESSPCMGLCEAGPNVRLVPSGMRFNKVTPSNLNELIKEIKAFIAC